MPRVVFQVTTKVSGLNIRTGPGLNYGYARLPSLPHMSTVVGDGQSQNGWHHIVEPAVGWSCGSYLTEISREEEPKPSTEPPVEEKKPEYTVGGNLVDESENKDSIWPSGRTITGDSDEDYQILFNRFIHSFGCPPRFTDTVDIPYTDNLTEGIGRVFASTILSNPAILSICPGSVDYLPGFSNQDKSEFLETVENLTDGGLNDRVSSEKDTFASGKLFEFKQAYTDYISVVNVLCRTMAIFLGIGNERMPGTSIKIKNFDFAWWNDRENAEVDDDDSSVFGQVFVNAKKMTSSAIGDDSYIHWFIMNQGTTISEDMSVSTEASILEQAINGSALDSVARNMNFLFGGPIGGNNAETGGFGKDIDAILNNSSGFLQSFGYLAKNYLSGGRLVFPQMISEVNYSKALSCSVKLVSPYGNKMAVFLTEFVPAAFMLALSLPKQVADNMYTYPFIVRVFQQGWFNSDLAVISNLRITKGGSDDTSWSVDALPTEMDITFDVLPLYSQLMVTPSTHPFLFMKNGSMLDYLGTMCGCDLKINNLDMKVDIAKALIRNRFSDIPTQLSRGIAEDITQSSKLRKIRNLFKIQE